MTTLGIDFSWSKPSPESVRAAGYSFVIGYISDDPSKDLSAAHVDAYHAAELDILLVFEKYARRSLEGAGAGTADAVKAIARARQLGFPDDVPIFFATDVDTTADKVRPYHRAIHNVRPTNGGYGGIKVVDPLLAEGIIRYSWQACAWSGGQVSTTAHLYQRLRPTLPLRGSFDENVLLRPLPMFRRSVPSPAPDPAPAPQPVPVPAPVGRTVPEEDMPYLMHTDDTEIDLVASGLAIHLSGPDAEFYKGQGMPLYNFRQAHGDAVRAKASA